MESVLLLNATFEPLAVLPLRRAIALVARERAEAVSDGEVTTVRGASGKAVDVPSVIRLRRYINVPRRNATWSRRALLARDNYTCGYCGTKHTASELTVDHILPVSRGGKSTWGNTIASCHTCNQRKGSRTPHEAGMRMMWEPKTPRTRYVVLSGDVPAEWKAWIEI